MNWGQGITVAIIIFILLTLGLVYFVVREKIELVDEDYYEQELNYNSKMEHNNNTIEANAKPGIEVDQKCVHILFTDSTQGKAFLFRPSEKKYDTKAEFKTDADGRWDFCPDALPRGNWRLILEWDCNGKTCYSEQAVTTP